MKKAAQQAKRINKKTANNTGPITMVPFMPPELIRDTTRFFNNKNQLAGLTNLAMSPYPADGKDTQKDRTEFQAEFEKAEYRRQVFNKNFNDQLHRAEKSMWRAIHQLPEELYEEAIASTSTEPPIDLRLHARFREQIFKECTGVPGFPSHKIKYDEKVGLSEHEVHKLQVMHNLMHVRYSHRASKLTSPDQFWIRSTQAVSRQKQAALRNIKNKK